jgi:hypothetical protein
MKGASHLKFEAEHELNKIRDEIEKRKITNIIYEDKLSDILEKHAPHNNLHIPISEVHPRYMSKDIVTPSNHYNNNRLRSEEDFIEPMSNLAKVGKTFITKSEFVPIEDGRGDYGAPKDIVNYTVAKMNETGGNFRDLYSKLNEITELNNKGVRANYNTMAKNYEVNIHSDYPDNYVQTKEKSELIIPETNREHLIIQNDNNNHVISGNDDFPFDESLKLA